MKTNRSNVKLSHKYVYVVENNITAQKYLARFSLANQVTHRDDTYNCITILTCETLLKNNISTAHGEDMIL